MVHNSVEHQKPDMFTESSGLDDFDETLSASHQPHMVGEEEEEGEGTVVPPGDFADELRRRISGEFNERQEIAGFQVSPSSSSSPSVHLAWFMIQH